MFRTPGTRADRRTNGCASAAAIATATAHLREVVELRSVRRRGRFHKMPRRVAGELVSTVAARARRHPAPRPAAPIHGAALPASLAESYAIVTIRLNHSLCRNVHKGEPTRQQGSRRDPAVPNLNVTYADMQSAASQLRSGGTQIEADLARLKRLRALAPIRDVSARDDARPGRAAGPARPVPAEHRRRPPRNGHRPSRLSQGRIGYCGGRDEDRDPRRLHRRRPGVR
jgi:hypothetical protein